MELSLQIKPFSFELIRPLKTSKGVIKKKKGWLLNLQDQTGRYGWGEVAPINQSEMKDCEELLSSLGKRVSRETLEKGLSKFPGSLGFGLGAALAEIDSLINFIDKKNWLKSCQSAFLLPTDDSLISILKSKLSNPSNKDKCLTFKWKVASLPNEIEQKLLDQSLNLLPNNARLRLDANGGWEREQAKQWVKYLAEESRLEWIEQPLSANDIQGMAELSKQIPIALDESLVINPSLRQTWKSWQIRKPLLEGDPRILLKELNEKIGYRVISSSFETGI